ncbi:pPIWI-associating nuclease domain-containing protein [Lelliottia nimipressuralis]
MYRLKEQYQEKINSVLLDGFEKELLDSAFINLLTPNPLRLNNFAYALRELTRHVLHRLAPDNELQQCQWFLPDKTSSTGITRKHRIKFAIQGGLSDFYVTKKLCIDEIEEVSSELIVIINRLSEFTHIEEATFKGSIEDTERTADECLSATLDFVNKIDELRAEVADKLFDDINDVLIERINCESVVELMELSPHQYIEEIIAEKISVVKIGVSSMEMHVDGRIGATLMYGSASDRRKGDGVEIPITFPVYSEMEVLFKQPLGSDINLNQFSVDISSWYE